MNIITGGGSAVPTEFNFLGGRRALAVDPAGVPVQLVAYDNWLTWRYEPRPGGSKPQKVPYSPLTGKRADPTDPKTWASFDAAVGRYVADRLEGYGGIGFAFPRYAATPTTARLAGVDWDDCLNPDGSIDPLAAQSLRQLDTYTERSPSGRGVKAIALADLDPTARKRSRRSDPYAVEIYPEGRYFTITGLRVAGFPATVEPRGDALSSLQRLLLPPDDATAPDDDRGPGFPGSDEELLAAAFAARNGAAVRASYLHADHGGHPTPSEALLGLAQRLAFWTGDNDERLDRLMRGSALLRATEGEREKWDARRGRSTWGMKYVVQPALATCRRFHSGSVRGTRDQNPDSDPKNMCKHGRHFATLAQSWKRANEGEYPAEVAKLKSRCRHTQAAQQRLLALCWHLAGRGPGGRFFLSGVEAAKRLGVDQTTADRWLRHFRSLRIIRRLRPGNSLAGVASEYVWVGGGRSTGLNNTRID